MSDGQTLSVKLRETAQDRIIGDHANRQFQTRELSFSDLLREALECHEVLHRILGTTNAEALEGFLATRKARL